MTTQPDRIDFMPVTRHEPAATSLIYGLAGCVEALHTLTVQGNDDRDLIGNLATAGHCLAQTLVHRMGGVLPAAEPGA